MIHLDYAYIVSSHYEFYVNHSLFSHFFDKKMAESTRFELVVACTTQPFQDCTLSRSDNSP